ncbi:hypothetical protein [Plantibacter flavus]|uniref:hypothetical protein n=1 Tax=Plantibacter flavus TaxID=150123 RepID=UPI0010C1B077|nr:hypothetical protein [Plantibacter flavus]
MINQRTSSDRPSQLARYVAPRLGRTLGQSQLVEAGPTALIVAMDAEGPIWGTQNARDRHVRELRELLRQEVAAQGGSLTDGELEILVQLHTWGEHKYELANFADEELETAITRVLRASPATEHADTNWASRLRSDIAYVRERKLDISVVFDRIQQQVSKVDLAESLVPVLLAKLEHDDTVSHAHPPVLDLVYNVVSLVNRFSGGGFALETPVAPSATDLP